MGKNSRKQRIKLERTTRNAESTKKERKKERKKRRCAKKTDVVLHYIETFVKNFLRIIF